MFRNVLQRFLFLFCGILLMCPKRARLTTLATNKHKPAYHNAIRQFMSSPAELNTDIVKDKDELTKVDEPGFDLTNEEILKFKIWPNGVIPYYIDVYSFSDKVLRDRIRSFLNMVNSATNLNFLELPSPPKDEDTRWVFFINRRGLLTCGDHSITNFTNQGVQKVVLGYDCMSTAGELAEAVLSIVGVPAQHNAPNRDQYIQILDENIIPEKKYLYEKINDDEWLFHDINYDYNSAGHYHCHKYSVNGQATIKSQKSLHESIGESNSFSYLDILKIKMLYNYMYNKKQNIPECHKLFAPGTDFQNYRPNNTNIEPRKKPSKYLGITKEDNGKSDDDKPPLNNNQDEVSNENLSDNANAEPEIKQDEHSDGYGDADYPITLKHQSLSKDGPLSYLSDYQTGAENVKMQLKVQPPRFRSHINGKKG